MPVFVENPAEFSKQRLRSELVTRSVELPPPGSEKHVDLEVYKRNVAQKHTAGFSSDEEEEVRHGDGDGDEDEEEERGEDLEEDSDMVDLSSLTDDQLKHKLLRYGVKAGPIVATTRALYERKLQRMMTQHSKNSVNNKTDAGKYSDSEEEEEDEDSGSEQPGPESVSHTDRGVTHSTVEMNDQSKETFYPQCFVPPVRQEQVINHARPYHSSLCDGSETDPPSGGVMTRNMEHQIENRLSPESKSAENEGSCSQTPAASRAQRQRNKSTTNLSLRLSPEDSPLLKQTTTIKPAVETVSDVLMEMFPDTATTPTGISATKRRSIKGAAGRPVQFKYPETPLSPSTLEKLDIQKRLVPLWVQVAVFLLVVAFLYFIYMLTEEPLENPFSMVLQSQETSSDDPSLISQDTHT